MYLDFNAQSPEPSAARKKRKDLDILPNPSLAADGFNIWWQKTGAQHTDVVAQASDLIRLHRRVDSVDEACIEQAH
jgi:hypothetical protein